MKIRRELRDKVGLAETLNQLGLVYARNGFSQVLVHLPTCARLRVCVGAKPFR
jgi:nitrogen fixation protein